jgi:hypothetical protein
MPANAASLDSLDPPSRHTAPRWSMIAAGLWLLATAFALHQGPFAEWTAAVAGLVIAGVGIASLYVPGVRYIATVVALLEIAVVVFTHHQNVTEIWNDGWAAVFVFATSLLPASPAAWTGRPRLASNG